MKFNWKSPLEEALAERQQLFVESAKETNCFRLFNGEREGIPGLVIEQYGDVVIFQVFENECQLDDEELKQIGDWFIVQRQALCIYKKTFVKDRSQQTAGTEYYSPEPLVGSPAPAEIMAKENGLNYLIQPFSGYSMGLFLDQRENRKFLGEGASGKEVLNLFAYTCGFSLACAANGAMTTSVDLSKKYLDWGKRNFELNRMDLKTHRFVPEDSFEFLKRAQKKGNQYDLVIVDPPSFSRTKAGGVFSLKKDYVRLLRGLTPLLRPKGAVFFSCNFSEWDSKYAKAKAQPVLDEFGNWEWKTIPEAPIDFESIATPLSQWMAVKL